MQDFAAPGGDSLHAQASKSITAPGTVKSRSAVDRLGPYETAIQVETIAVTSPRSITWPGSLSN
jgi:hypothetical protein